MFDNQKLCMAIRILNQPVKDKDLNRNYGDWRNSQSAIVPNQINSVPETPNSDVDIISNMMDGQNNECNSIKQNSFIPHLLSKEEMAKKMIDDFVRQNGSIIVREDKKQKLILG